MSTTTAEVFGIGRERQREQPNNISTPVQHPNVAENTNMPPRRHVGDTDDLFEIRDLMHTVAASVAVQTETQKQLSASVAVLVQAQSRQTVVAANGNKWTGWIQTGVVCAMLLVSGTNAFKSSESDLKMQLALQDQQLKQQTEATSKLTDRVMSIEFIWARVRQDIAAYGLQIDAQTGVITQVKKGRQ